ncbi:RCC1 domain-containing protein [Polyangium sorediatum]|uniref:RCC1-like domain-containing protein n=1 Tax=Polyangium sorediatum TaxID=889274 RepID=A0ABT6NR36_9BACT|nr:hypothetical protein [Polyangium sorediatum]MDI1430778.1 hypothetical protein [Polyangium sorediatum]
MGRTFRVGLFGTLALAAFAGLASPACNAITGLDRFEVDPVLGSGAAGGVGQTCSTELDCPGETNECQTRACVAGRCELSMLPEGAPAQGQTPGDCMRTECDAEGQTRTVVDTSDAPGNGFECTVGECSPEGEPSISPRKQGSACTQGGGAVCDGSGKCVECNFSSDCSGGGPCSAGLCVPPECTDGSKNGDESDIDCGGPVCPPCGTGKGCTAIADCESKVCIAGVCQSPTCSDGVHNATETDADCGGGDCPDCQDGKSCLIASDCVSGVCTAGVCQAPTCSDAVKNGAETDVDCGGVGCAPCASGKTCAVHVDCASEACLGGTCASIVQISAGSTNACVLLGDGTVRCWGANTQGQIGDGTVVEKLSPTPVSGLSGVTQISVGSNRVDTQGTHACARTGDGKVSCWGRNATGQIGNGSTAAATTPKAVNLTNVVQVAAGGRHTCARLMTGTVRCWGAGTAGQLGNNVAENRTTPTGDLANVTATALAAGDMHNCAVLQSGEVRCWGDGSDGQLGSGVADRLVPTLVPNLTGISQVSAGNRFTCVVSAGGTALRCMGENAGGQLGIGNTTQQNAPALVPGLMDITGLSLGTDATLGGHSCVVLAGGGLRCFGANTRGELGTGDKTNQSTPQMINVPPVAEVALGLQFTCVRLVSGPVRCWGRNDLGQLGTGAKGADQTAPVPVVFP